MGADPDAGVRHPLGGDGPAVVAAQVARWRSAHGVQQDADFAYAFLSFEDADRVAGPELAAAWQQARARTAERWRREASRPLHLGHLC